jgi:triosephosphate isomerase
MNRILVANWKMNKTVAEALAFIREIKKQSFSADLGVFLAPDFLALAAANEALAGSEIKISGQDVSPWPSGAYTGEVSARQLAAAGCSAVIIGHSERRNYLHETDRLIREKIKRAFESDLLPILCVGESLAEREAGETEAAIVSQLKADLSVITDYADKNLVIAYEPVWAISAQKSGRTVAPVEIESAAKIIKRTMQILAGEKYFAQKVKIIYGGSADSRNTKEFLAVSGISGLLVGGASLDSVEFGRIIAAADFN